MYQYNKKKAELQSLQWLILMTSKLICLYAISRIIHKNQQYEQPIPYLTYQLDTQTILHKINILLNLNNPMEKVKITDLLALQDKQVDVPAIVQELHDKAPSLKVKPISKKKQQQMLRQTNYKITTEDLDKWVGIVKVNREKQSLNFAQKFIDQTRVNFFTQKPQSQLQQKIQKQLAKRQIQNPKQIIQNQQKVLETVDPEEAKRRLLQARKHRTTVFYEEIKRRRIAKIKSKLYRKIKKRQRVRLQTRRVLEMEGEEKNQYLEMLAKKRIKERITLRHRTKNTHILNILRFNKNNKDAYQQSVNEINQVRRTHLEKNKQDIEMVSSEEYDNQKYRDQALADLQQEIKQLEKDQHQIGNQKSGIDGMRFMKNAKQQSINQEKTEAMKLLHRLQMRNEDEELISQEESQHQQPQKPEKLEKIQNTKDRLKYDTAKDTQLKEHKKESTIQGNLRDFFRSENQANLASGFDIKNLKVKYNPEKVEMDLTDIISKNKQLFQGFNNLAAEENMRDFHQQKLAQYEQNAGGGQKVVKGWGKWTGPGIKQKKITPQMQLKKKIARIEQIKRKRKDGQISHVTINESRNKQLSQYMVRKLPHQFKSSQQFDYLQSNKIGPQWNTMTQFQENIKKRIQTKPGVAINPIKLPKKTQLLKR